MSVGNQNPGIGTNSIDIPRHSTARSASVVDGDIYSISGGMNCSRIDNAFALRCGNAPERHAAV